jgi:hypothetical protein
MEKSPNTTAATGIVAKIVNFLKLGEEGKIGSFFERLRKNLKRQIEAQRKNLENAAFNNTSTIDSLTDRLEDANQALEEAYMNVRSENVATNADQEAYEAEYWYKVEKAESAVSRIKKEIESTTQAYEKTCKEINAQIEELEFRLAKIA